MMSKRKLFLAAAAFLLAGKQMRIAGIPFISSNMKRSNGTPLGTINCITVIGGV